MTEEHHHEHHAEHEYARHLKEKVDKTTFLAAVGALAVLLILLFAYSFVQFDSINKRISAPNPVLEQLAAMQQRVAVLETRSVAATPTPEPARLVVYFDSSCEFCSDITQAVSYLGQQLGGQNILVEEEDVEDRVDELRAAGFKSLPVIFMPAGEESKNEAMKQLAQAMQPVSGGYAMDAYGVLTDAKQLLGNDCAAEGVVRLDEFYSETCPYCLRLNAGTPPVTANESMPQVKEDFGAFLQLTERCIEIHDGDEALCVGKWGRENYDEAMRLRDEYGVTATPTFVVDCKQVFGGLTVEQIEEKICRARPDVCAAANVTVSS
ncbi:MAG: hypothetical protein AB1626_04565 [Candidatus Micrarchaeota archaeon]